MIYLELDTQMHLEISMCPISGKMDDCQSEDCLVCLMIYPLCLMTTVMTSENPKSYSIIPFQHSSYILPIAKNTS